MPLLGHAQCYPGRPCICADPFEPELVEPTTVRVIEGAAQPSGLPAWAFISFRSDGKQRILHMMPRRLG